MSRRLWGDQVPLWLAVLLLVLYVVALVATTWAMGKGYAR